MLRHGGVSVPLATNDVRFSPGRRPLTARVEVVVQLHDAGGRAVDRVDPQLLGIAAMRTVLLLCVSNTFMTVAWYGHLKHRDAPLLQVIVISWLIAFAEYAFQVPANRIGYGEFTGYQLKIIQEVITLIVFAAFAAWYLGEPIRWNYALAFVFILCAVASAFWGRL